MNNQNQFLYDVLRGNESAVIFCQRLFSISQIVDDLYDGDNEIDREDIKRMIWYSLVELPSNAFYRENFFVLQPLIRMALTDWIDSTVLEQGELHDKTIAFVLRDALNSVVSQCIYLVGGYEWMVQVSPAVRRFFHDETLSDYLNESEHDNVGQQSEST